MQLDKRFLLPALIHWVITLFFEKSFFLSSLSLKLPFLLAKIIVITCFWQIIAYIWRRYRSETPFRQFIHYASIYFLFSFFILLLIWPGNWYWDELSVLLNLRAFNFIGWQHILTGIDYLCALFLFPSPVSIVILQIFCISLVVGYFVFTIKTVTNTSRLWWLAYLPFLLLPVIHQNYSTYRATLFSYLILFFLVYILYQWWQQKKISNAMTVALAVTATVIATWRGEGLYFVIVAPLLYMCSLWTLSTSKQKILFLVVLGIGFASISGLQKKTWGDEDKDPIVNQLSTYVVPLAALIKQAQQDNRSDLLKDIDEVLDIQVFDRYETAGKAYWSHQLIRPAYFEIGPKKLLLAYLKLIQTYPSVFFQERWQAFNLTSINPMRNTNAIFQGAKNEEAAPIFKKELLSDYLYPEIRTKTLNFLTLDSYPNVQKVVHHCGIPIALLFILTLYFLLTKRFVLALASSAVLPAAFLAFLSIPDYFFMYFFSSYLVGYAWLTAVILVWVSKKCPNR